MSEKTGRQWRGFVSVIVTAYFEQRMAWWVAGTVNGPATLSTELAGEGRVNGPACQAGGGMVTAGVVMPACLVGDATVNGPICLHGGWPGQGMGLPVGRVAG